MTIFRPAALCALALTLTLGLAACGAKEEPPPETPSEVSPAGPPEAPPAPPAKPQVAPSSAPEEAAEPPEVNDTLWTAVREEGSGAVLSLPTEDRQTDLLLFSDGTGRFRDTERGIYRSGLVDCTWKLDDSGLLTVTSSDSSEALTGWWEGEELALTYNGGTLRMTQSPFPAYGARLTTADLGGRWRLVSTETSSGSRAAWEAGAAAWIQVALNWDGQPLPVFSYSYRDAYGNRASFSGAEAEVREKPLYEGCPNDSWCLALPPAEGEAYAAALTDPDTLLLLRRREGEEAVLDTYRRLPDTPELVAYTLSQTPENALALYWPDPTPELRRELSRFPVTDINGGGESLLLLAGAAEDVVIRFCSPEALPAEDPAGEAPAADAGGEAPGQEAAGGTQADTAETAGDQDAPTGEVYYSAPLDRGELSLFSLNIPEEDEPPEVWLLLYRDRKTLRVPITVMDGHDETGWMFLTEP